MIVVWPLITSKTINPTILQGVCKSLEKYVFIHRLDDILERANENIKKHNKKRNQFLTIQNIFGKRVLRLESIDYEESENILSEAQRGPDPTQGKSSSNKTPKSSANKTPKSSANKTPKSSPRKTPRSGYKKPNKPSQQNYGQAPNAPSLKPGQPSGEEREKPEKKVAQSPNIGKMDMNVMSQEPTWQQVTDQEGNVTAIGVKVVPFIMNNDSSLIELMTTDKYRKGMDMVVQMQSRKILRFMFRLANYTWKKTAGLFSFTGLVSGSLKSGSLTQEWKTDVILQNTSFGKDMFILLNKMDLEEDFTTNAKGVSKLFNLGWTSFLVADDMNKSVSFCMNTYKGMCSVINYSFLYADGKSGYQVYKDIDDVRKSSGPLFRLNRRKKTMITDDLALSKLNQYSISESYLNEGVISDIMSLIKNEPKKLVSNINSIKSAVKRQDLNLAYRISKKISPSDKKVEVHKLIDKELRVNKNFKKNYDLSYQVFKNSISDLPEDILKVGAGLVASISLLSKDKNYNIKTDLKKIVMKTREKAGESQYEKDVKLAFIFSLIFVVVTGPGTIWLAYMILSYIGIAATTVTANIIPIIVVTSLVYALKIFAAKQENKAAE